MPCACARIPTNSSSITTFNRGIRPLAGANPPQKDGVDKIVHAASFLKGAYFFFFLALEASL
jgi:hypothetical protein